MLTSPQAAGAFTFALTMMIWYVLAVQLLEAVDFPLTLSATSPLISKERRRGPSRRTA
jgi:hypothetical protein